mmetsp:Transcript_343/g.1010  ORF Transcript_343/g.1010 Transcript_343/m.1010 type:complete len:92 (-) Transcript_343:345-620(-)|eukprot:CAMPEP_0198653506 /NCGR_PEP_ID=MMETSP1467-20131203/7096_1 /TAXON_ID=1462469 /ORGANISM="unid. sp., Strain CCMP2135" /LENGTH=91 /DNA_ID=CAMNT_0044389469 /DNA_START=945 /DNA_END=1220 /DNA_ORIENTATION=-
MSVRGLMAMMFETPEAKLAMKNVSELTSFAMNLAPWGLPLVMAGCWCVYPALTTSFKQSIGLEKAPPSNQDFEFSKEGVGEVPELVKGSVN